MIRHQRQFAGTNHVAGFRQDRRVQGDHIAPGEKLVELHFRSTNCGRVFHRKKRVVGGDLEFSAREHLHDKPTNS
ncbi:hypothetical protein D3C71_2152890 [compost metagenome]